MVGLLILFKLNPMLIRLIGAPIQIVPRGCCPRFVGSTKAAA
jgi:hypothetical protein